MFEKYLDSETANPYWCTPRGRMVQTQGLGQTILDIFMLQGKSDELKRAKWNDSEREVLMVNLGPVVKCPLVYVPIGACYRWPELMWCTSKCYVLWQKFLVEDVLLPPDVLDMLGGAQSEEKFTGSKLSGPEG
ncbi:hypothetical protein TNCV_1717091 [Trichonephila clavipes]|nr:hypothetical protein TNCV_1717091 [Trichonephila clavipes]